MKRLQLNAKSFKETRDVMSAYFGAKFELAEMLKKCKDNADAYAKVMAKDREDLARLTMGVDTVGIVRDVETIKKSLAVATASYNANMKPYETLKAKSDKAIADAVALFNDKESALYKAYAEYVVDTTDEKYAVYADAMAKRFVALGLTDATAENVAHYMPNVDREVRGKSAVKVGDIQTAVNPNVFANAVLRKIYVTSKSAFATQKWLDYVKAEREKAEKKSK